jgi:hypothetical protein
VDTLLCTILLSSPIPHHTYDASKVFHTFRMVEELGTSHLQPAALSRIPHPTMPRELLHELLYQTMDPTLPFSLATFSLWLGGP